jgi:hypothetical protein
VISRWLGRLRSVYEVRLVSEMLKVTDQTFLPLSMAYSLSLHTIIRCYILHRITLLSRDDVKLGAEISLGYELHQAGFCPRDVSTAQHYQLKLIQL